MICGLNVLCIGVWMRCIVIISSVEVISVLIV